jgi:hypothetical protein
MFVYVKHGSSSWYWLVTETECSLLPESKQFCREIYFLSPLEISIDLQKQGNDLQKQGNQNLLFEGK